MPYLYCVCLPQDSQPQQMGKRQAALLVHQYKERCIEKIKEKKFGPQEFEASMFDYSS